MKILPVIAICMLFAIPSSAVLAEVAEQNEEAIYNEAPISINKNMVITSKPINEDSAELKATIKAIYPQITGQKLPAHAKQFNQNVQTLVTNEIQRFKNYVKLDLTHMQTLPESIQQNHLNIDYDIDVIHPSQHTAVMVRLNIEGMQAGRAHPYHIHRVINFDLDTGKAISLADLFKHNSDYLKLIAKLSRQQLLAKLHDKTLNDMVVAGTKANPKNFQNWNIQNDNLLITFDEYQVAPYVNGSQEVEIPYSQLKKVIAPSAIISSCVGDLDSSNKG